MDIPELRAENQLFSNSHGARRIAGEGPMLNRLIGPLIVILIGLALTGFGFINASEKAPECDGKTMHRADTCRQAKGSRNSYDEQLRADHDMGRVAIGAGAAVMIGGVLRGIRNYRRRPGVSQQQPPRGAQYYAQPGNPSHYPPPGMPGQYPPPSGPPQYPPGMRPRQPPQYPPPSGPPQYPPPQYPPGMPPRQPPQYPPPQYPPPGGPPQYPPPGQR
ncbi:hypothetical protein A9W94_19045 [Mycobacterium asiaticum]|nr:hypothetical protein A9W94_19045 [Mycobacterium asiaticum]